MSVDCEGVRVGEEGVLSGRGLGRRGRDKEKGS